MRRGLEGEVGLCFGYNPIFLYYSFNSPFMCQTVKLIDSHYSFTLLFPPLLSPLPPPPPPQWSFSSLQELRAEGVVAKQVFKKAD